MLLWHCGNELNDKLSQQKVENFSIKIKIEI
jgi:hypothetical protein